MRAKYIVFCFILCILCTTLVECCLMAGRYPDSRQPAPDIAFKRTRVSSIHPSTNIDNINCGMFRSSFMTSYRTVSEGIEANHSEFPWLVSIQKKRTGYFESKCAGSLISSRYVLTAAHCFYHWENNMKMTIKEIRSLMRVVAGTENLNSAGSGGQIRRIKHVWPTNKYVDTDFSHKHDIAVVKLKTKLIYSDCSTVCPICLPDLGFQRSRTIILAGWGNKWHPYGAKLYKMSLITTKNKICENKLQNLKVHLLRSQMCSVADQHNACIDDVGGPGMNIKSKRMFLVGIVTLQNLCQGGAVIYTKVQKYTKWIRKVVLHMESGKAPPRRSH